jgi:sodium-dependent dicarboxylate transporter 2/3/5
MNNSKRIDYKYLICSIIGLLLMFGFRLFPAFGDVTALGMNLIGIFLGVIFLWCTVGVIWPSILALLALVLSGSYNMNAVIQASFGNQVVWTVIFVFFLIAAITKSGAAEFLARWFISRKVLSGRPFLFTWVYFLSFYLIAMFSNGAAIMLLSWTITRTVAEVLGLERSHKYIKFLYLFGSLSCALGESSIPFKGYVLGLATSFSSVAGTNLNYAAYIIFAVLMGVSIITILALSTIYVFKADVSSIRMLDTSKLQDSSAKHLTFRQACYFGALVLVVFLVLLQTVLPQDLALVKLIGTFGMPGLLAFVVALMIAVKIDGKPIYDFKTYSPGAVRWEAIFIVGSISPLASAIGSQDAGVLSTIGKFAAPIFGQGNLVFILIIVILATLLLTNLLSNSGIGLLLIPIVIPILQQIGVSDGVFVVMCIALIYSVTLGVMLPGASTMAALFYTNEDLNGKDIFKYGGYMCLIYAILAIPVFAAWLNIAK